jgi:hypothetical protein
VSILLLCCLLIALFNRRRKARQQLEATLTDEDKIARLIASGEAHMQKRLNLLQREIKGGNKQTQSLTTPTMWHAPTPTPVMATPYLAPPFPTNAYTYYEPRIGADRPRGLSVVLLTQQVHSPGETWTPFGDALYVPSAYKAPWIPPRDEK